MTTIKSINPFNNQLLKEYEEMSEGQLNSSLEKAHSTFLKWKNVSFEERSILMSKSAEILRTKKLEYARLITLEMGKPIKQSISEIEKCADCCDYYAKYAKQFLADEIAESDGSKSFIGYQPLGCILAIMPWNFPFWQVFRFAAPALMAGNVGVLKHASNVSGCSKAIEEVFTMAGFPQGCFQSLIIGSSKVKYVIEHKVVQAVTLTGSEKAGADVASIAGKQIKKTVLELGGSDAFIVLNDADIDKAAEVAIMSRMINNGQSCIAAKRFIIEKNQYDLFLEKMKMHMENYKMGDPLNDHTSLGPLARVDLAKDLDSQVKDTLKQGGKLFFQKQAEFTDAFYPTTMLTDVKPGMRAYEEELFGPVATVYKANDQEEAIYIANDSKFGLGCSIWSKDLDKAIAVGRKIDAGSVFVNGLVKSDPRLPFGGVKASGYGRELSYVGIREFVNIKTFWVK
jgi:succinate-semialdehyde dehydrogenase/glutarate-semialdehyde dehydrogenase